MSYSFVCTIMYNHLHIVVYEKFFIKVCIIDTYIFVPLSQLYKIIKLHVIQFINAKYKIHEEFISINILFVKVL